MKDNGLIDFTYEAASCHIGESVGGLGSGRNALGSPGTYTR